MNFKIYLTAFIGLCLISCSSDDDFIEEPNVESFSFTAIGQDSESLLEFTYNSETEQSQLVNLTSQLEINGFFLTLRQVERTMSYYSFFNGSFSLALKDMDTGAIDLLPEITINSIDKSIAWGTNSKETVHFGFFSPSGSTSIGVRNINITNSETNDLQIAFDAINFFEPLYHDQKLFISYRDLNEQNKVQVYSLESQNFIRTLDFGNYSPSLLIDDEGNLAVIKSRLGIDTELEIYNFDSLNLIETTAININSVFRAGAINAALVDNKLYYEAQFTQPSPITFGPAVFDIIDDEDNRVDLVSIINQVQSDMQNNVSITVQGYSEINNQFYVGYVVSNTDEMDEGGVLVISEEGQLIENINVPFSPIYFLRD